MNRPMNALVSIIIPCYNAENWISYAIKSALEQTYKNIEIIVVDDGSTDSSLSIIKSFGESIRWATGPNRGASATRNKGLRIAKGEYIQFLDADDMLHPQKVEISLQALREFPNFGYVWSPYLVIAAEPPIPKAYGISIDLSDVSVQTSNRPLDAHYAPWAALFRKIFLESVGPWNEDLRGCEDLEYHARIARITDYYILTSAQLYFYRNHDGARQSDLDQNDNRRSDALCCIRAAHAILESSKISQKDCNEMFWPFYVGISRSYASIGDLKMFCELLGEGAKLRNSWLFSVKCNIAIFIAKMIGSKETEKLLKFTLSGHLETSAP